MVQLIIAFVFIFLSTSSLKASEEKYTFQAWGPGLTPEKIILPTRYFFVAVFNNKGERLTTSPGKKLTCDVVGTYNLDPYHMLTEVLDTNDGGFIIRYKIFTTFEDVSISIKWKGDHVASSPYEIPGIVLPDSCVCPVLQLSKWIKETCPEDITYQRIEKDLLFFQSVDFPSALDRILEKFTSNSSDYALCHYVIRYNKIHRRCYGKKVAFHKFINKVLFWLTRRAKLTDTEFIVNLADQPLVMKDVDLPIFSWGRSTHTKDILLPTYELTMTALEAMGRIPVDMMSTQSFNSIPWSEKDERGFFRGKDSNKARLKLVRLSKLYPHMINASLTTAEYFPDHEKELGPLQPRIRFFSFFDYKYQVNIDGSVAAYRLPTLLAGGSAVIKQDSIHEEYFYPFIKSMEHYIPVRDDLSNIVEQILWARNHDFQTEQMAKAARKFAQESLMPLPVLCYHAHLINEWTKRLAVPVVVRGKMDAVWQWGERNCTCPEEPHRKDEL